jgi:hypothetical protein
MREKAAMPLSTAACAVIEVVVAQEVSNSKTGLYARIHTPTSQDPLRPWSRQFSDGTLRRLAIQAPFYFVVNMDRRITTCCTVEHCDTTGYEADMALWTIFMDRHYLELAMSIFLVRMV